MADPRNIRHIKNGALVDLPLVTMAEWLESGRDPEAAGVRLSSECDVTKLAEDAPRLKLIALDFPKFADGRAFTQARLLRERYGFTGELRATGRFLPDQAAFLAACGVDCLEISANEDAAKWEKAMAVITTSYQAPRRDARGAQKPSILAARRRARTLEARVEEWADAYADAPAHQLLDAFLNGAETDATIALVSSFGAEAAALLSLVADVRADTPVIFIDTGRHFAETLQHRDELVDFLGLTDVRTVGPHPDTEKRLDPGRTLYAAAPDACCHFRKKEPLTRALVGVDGWITGRKRHHGGPRARLPKVEFADGKLKLNPLADWTPKEVNAYARERGLPRHPLLAKGYLSIGCMPCTTPVAEGEDPRAGRWRTQDKVECGIHLAE